MKIMNYNIRNGFCNEVKPYKFDEKRLKLVSNILEKEKPNILILTEAYFWPFAKQVLMKNFNTIFNRMYKFYENPKDHFRYAPIVLSKFPIKSYDYSMAEFQLNYLRVVLEIDKKEIKLDVFHPHPEKSEKEKVKFYFILVLVFFVKISNQKL